MAELDMSLESYAEKQKSNKRKGANNGGRRGGGRGRRGGRRGRGGGGGPLFKSARGELEKRGKAPYKGRADGAWKNDKFEEIYDDDVAVAPVNSAFESFIPQPQVVAAQSSVPASGDLRSAIKATESKLLVSNIEKQITEDELLQLFSGIGKVKSLHLNFNSEGNSQGTAVVVYMNRADATKAVAEFSGRQLDGETLLIEYVVSELQAPAAATSSSVVNVGQVNDPLQRIKPTINYVPRSQNFYDDEEEEDTSTYFGLARNSNTQRRRRGGNRNFNNHDDRVGRGSSRGGRNNRGGRQKSEDVSAEDLDAQMAKYMQKKTS